MKKLLSLAIIVLLFSCSGNKTEQKKSPNNAVQSEKEETTETPKSPEPSSNKSTLVPENEMIAFEDGSFMMGSDKGLPQEAPIHKVSVKAFKIDKSPVTVAEFKIFMKTTGYKTEAEKFGDSGVFNMETQAWELLPGAFWLKPFGPSGPEAVDDHPVTHTSWNDAVQYASWAGKRLPTEAEWEYAARSGKNSGNKFSWGNEVSKVGK
jgi:sulfatase modifying factor 1